MGTDRAKDQALDAISIELARELERRADEFVSKLLESMRGSLSSWMYEPPVRDEIVHHMRES